MFDYTKEYKYPSSWDDEDICKFKYYLKMSKEMYTKLPEDIIELCVERQIMEEKGLLPPFDYSIIKKIEELPKPVEIYESKTETEDEIKIKE
jgi:hypothetical protein